MPFIRISYREDQYKQEELPSISRAIHQALTEFFRVPEDDYFQVFHGHKQSEFYYDPAYLDGSRTDRLLYIQITLKSGRTEEQKRGFYARLAELLPACGVRAEDIFVVLVGTEFEDWTFGGGIAQMLEQAKGESRHA
ncbi:tautomerase family protein [Paenibacillus glycanilyticus]|uniref:Tautomerase YusQ n=1 Tax=Paenibacillus glycanilyticus TaxID=126569 RepID=A0ABQ6GHA9_9BACL|nr:tautomerase family protein [Paenibacillus glycanilyticus]GLX70274.1 putative tautomerase YusQ [Paenibacillus glycanilyticus]